MRLTGYEYDKIEEFATDMLDDLGIKEFPVDCFKTAELLGIKLKRYSDLTPYDADFILKIIPDGFSLKKARSFYIYFNDMADKNRIKFTIWHEIAHIQLSHDQILTGDNISDNYKAKLEEAANHFAQYIMCPPVFIYKLGLTNELDIAEACGISYSLASNVYNRCLKAYRFPIIREKIYNSRIAKILTYNPFFQT